MYGKIFETMFTGSMMGSGALAFAVWSYVIAHQRPSGGGRDKFAVELNAKIIGFLIGESEEDVRKKIEEFCEPDGKSRSQEKEGRKLVQVGTFLYEVVNGAHYDRLKRDCERLESARERQARYRERRKEGKPLPGEEEYVSAMEAGASEEELDEIVDRPRRRRRSAGPSGAEGTEAGQNNT